MHWIPFAMVRVTAVFIAGIVLCIFQPALISRENGLIILLIFLTIYLVTVPLLRRSFLIKEASGLIGLFALFSCGYVTVLWRDEKSNVDHIVSISEKITACRVKIITPLEEKQNSLKRTGVILSVKTENGWRNVSSKVNLYWSKSENIADLNYGDILLINGAPRGLEPAYNPGEFDFKEYLSFKNIYHQHYVKRGDWIISNLPDDHGFLFYAHRARNWSVKAIRENIASPREQGLVTALVLGVVDGLDTDLLNAYAASGAMHVLAVSGLHVSIIYGILLFIFRPLGKGHISKWIIAIASLTLLWSYAFITGLSPSVLRAVTMFSFVAIAKPVGRSTNFYNTLAASAFCLLLYDPYLIMSAGFQLSYLAVLGIVYLQRPIYNLWEAKSWFMNWAWELSCVSIAAQIATFALGFFYFHQFPVYFLLANLFIIPGSFVVLVGGILLLLISPFHLIASWLGVALEWFVRILNEGIFLVERLPFCLINDVYISAFQCFLLFVIVMTVLALIKFRKFRFIVIATGVSIVFSFISWMHFTKDVRKSLWTVYRVQGHTAMEWSDDGSGFFVADPLLLKDERKLKFHISGNRLLNGVMNTTASVRFPVSWNGMQFYQQSSKVFLWLNSPEYRLPDSLTVDYLIISNNAVKSLASISDHIHFGMLILDSSNKPWTSQRIQQEGLATGKQIYSVLDSGALVIGL